MDNTNKAIKAIEDNDLLLLNKALEEGVSPNSVDEYGIPLIHTAIKNMNLSLIETLLKHGADVNIISPEEIILEISSKTVMLSDNKFRIKDLSPLMTVINTQTTNQVNKEMIVTTLINYGANVNESEKNYNLSPIHLAANNCRPKLLKILIDAGSKINEIAFQNVDDEGSTYKNNVTPLLLATNSKFKDKSSECLHLLIEAGADLKIQSKVPWDVGEILNILSESQIDLAENLLEDNFSNDMPKFDKVSVLNSIDTFLKRKIKNETSIEKFIEELLIKGVDFSRPINSIKHFSHMHSWHDFVDMNVKGKHTTVDIEGWQVWNQVPRKIKGFLMVLDDIENDKVDCIQRFNENKEVVVKKIKEEIWAQTTNYFTTNHQWIIGELKNEKLAKKMTKIEAENWCYQINKLKCGEFFSTTVGYPNHVVYMELRKQLDGNISRVIYNLGGGSQEHNVSLENKKYPHVVCDIDAELFKNYSPEALDYLTTVIKAKRIKSLFPEIYSEAFKIGKAPSSVEDFIPMKEQVAGNCSVKNNQSAIRNRLRNDKIYSFLKANEIKLAEAKLNIPQKLYRQKELEKNISNFDKMLEHKRNSLIALEAEMYRFFKKRTKLPAENIDQKLGNRLADAIVNANDSRAMKYYIAERPELIEVLSNVSKLYNSERLENLTKKYAKDYSITPKR